MFLGYHGCEVMKEWVLPVQYTDQPMGSGDQIAPRSYHRLNNEKRGGVCRACKYHNIWLSMLYHWELHPLFVEIVTMKFAYCCYYQSHDGHLAAEAGHYEVLCQDLLQRSLQGWSEPENTFQELLWLGSTVVNEKDCDVKDLNSRINFHSFK